MQLGRHGLMVGVLALVLSTTLAVEPGASAPGNELSAVSYKTSDYVSFS